LDAETRSIDGEVVCGGDGIVVGVLKGAVLDQFGIDAAIA
jgi:hypothetical protein